MILCEMGRSKRAGLRVPVDFDVKCESVAFPVVVGKALNLSIGGLCVMTEKPIGNGVQMNLEFLMPTTLNSIKVQGQSVWSSPCKTQLGSGQGTGIRFIDIDESSRRMILDYSLKKLYDNDFLRREGIMRVLGDIRNLPAEYRLKAYHILIKKGSKDILPD
jgi:Tfp pilus assembly protein PilZ